MSGIDNPEMIPFPYIHVRGEGSIAGANRLGEMLMDELASTGISRVGRFLVDRLRDEELVFKTVRGTYGLKTLRSDEVSWEIVVIVIDEFKQSLGDIVDISSLQHEIKNPLTVIDGTAQLIAAKSSDDYLKKCTDIILKESGRIKSMLSNIHLLSEMSIEISPFSMEDFAADLRDSVMIIFPDVDIKLHAVRNLDRITADREKLFMAVYNILKNAAEAQKEGDIHIELSIDPTIKYRHKDSDKVSPMLRIVITDTGPGIEDTVYHKLFTPFFTTKNKGTGLGLVIAKEIVEKHHGRIEVSSRKGSGTSFSLFIPCYTDDI
ncbi:two-component system sensor histidine kinase NtrB [Limisalsivibrio acetivorans]|uniref:two-component system sensor histidine kinase NtrB n=1 Tax=Limisalsivibrio acetivorans TaxID=1304888 RepID=UPI0003B50AA2|nr:HAMP domain-containing sensor histidine kinase [Limisalsivibrio acetivorans]